MASSYIINVYKAAMTKTASINEARMQKRAADMAELQKYIQANKGNFATLPGAVLRPAGGYGLSALSGGAAQANNRKRLIDSLSTIGSGFGPYGAYTGAMMAGAAKPNLNRFLPNAARPGVAQAAPFMQQKMMPSAAPNPGAMTSQEAARRSSYKSVFGR